MEGIHANTGVVDLKFAEPRVDDILDPVEGQGSLGNIGSYDAFSGLGDFKDLCLDIRGELGVNGEDEHLGGAFDLVESFCQEETGGFDVFLAGHEDEDVTHGLLDVDGQGLADTGVYVVIHDMLAEKILNRKRPPRNLKYWHSPKETRKLLRIHRSTGHYQPQIPPPRTYLPQYPKQHIRIERPFMGLIHHYARVLVKF